MAHAGRNSGPLAAAALLALLGTARAYNNGLAALPPRGWSTWCTDDLCGLIDLCWETEIQSVADAMVSTGMVAAGYKLVLLDDCWSAETRDANGNLQPDPSRFPSGIPALVEYLETRGMYLGLYTCAGNITCKWQRPGSLGHFQQDAQQLANWGVGHCKMDWCTHGPLPPQDYYGNMSHFLNATGKPIQFATCDWGEGDPWTGWGGQVAQMFRVGGDHLPFWSYGGGSSGQGTANVIELMAEVGNFTSQYSWNDYDFMHTLFPTFTVTESMTEASFWSFLAAPMIIDTDPRNASAAWYDIALNADLLAINWDPLFQPGWRVWNDTATSTQLWRRPLANGDQAVILYNANDTAPNTIAATWAAIGWPARANVSVYDVWAHKTVGTYVGGLSAVQVPVHGSAYWRLTLVANGTESV